MDLNQENLLPVVPLRNSVPLPATSLRLDIGRPSSVKALDAAERGTGKQIILLIQKNPDIENPEQKDLEQFGVIAKVGFKIKNDLPGTETSYKVKFHVSRRIKLINYFPASSQSPFASCSFEYADVESQNLSEKALVTQKLLVEKNREFLKSAPGDSKELSNVEFNSAEEVYLLGNSLTREFARRLNYLNANTMEDLLKTALIDFEYLSMTNSLEKKIQEEVQRSIDEAQREYFLREKMKAIQNELGDRARKIDEIEQIRAAILAAKMPAQTEANLLNELKKYQTASSYSPEAGSIKTYLDFAVSLPWNKFSKDCTDIKKVKTALDKKHYGLKQVKDKILEYLSVQIKTKKVPQAILCLVGPPGTGKTSLAISIAEALNKHFTKISLGGADDESDILGFRRTYVGALPGRILKGMVKAGTKNPLFLLDEIDKIGKSHRGDPAAALLEVLDPSQNFRFEDHFLEEPFDLSKVMFITTANYLENIPEPLMDRMEIIQLSSYTEVEKYHIATEYLIPENLKLAGIKPGQLTFTDAGIYKLIQHYTREAGIRELNRLIGTISRKFVKKLLAKELTSLEINEDNLEQYLGKFRFFHNIADQKDQVGVVTGLAYTAYGGDTLKIEANTYAGKGDVVLTGKLGDVMKESAITALSFVKSKAEEFGIDPEIFVKNTIHIHVPEGAVPKDGPSAGITMCTAIVSLLTKKPVKHTIGMTGEITLTGQILPIGGLKEKAISAHRSGLKQILIPKDNVRDVQDIPEEVLKDLEITPVSEIKEVLKAALVA